jgi:Leucine-rich repeat (LRR) protein
MRTKITDRALRSLGDIMSLESLYLDGTQVQSEGLAYLGTLPHLSRLDLRDTTITDESLAVLGAFPSLTQMDLSESAITNQGLRYLETLKLTSLLLQETQTTEEGRDILRQMIRKCRILPNP